MNKHRYILEKYTGRNSRFECPDCKKANQFSKYIDTETGEVVADIVGRCNRVDKCGCHYTPRQYFDDNGKEPERNMVYTHKSGPPILPVSYIDNEIFYDTLSCFHYNSFVIYLHKLFSFDIVSAIVNLYMIGTSHLYNGESVIFWQIDAAGNVRTGKLMKYDDTGHRIKSINDWAHSVLNIDNFNLQQCFFGEHILKYAKGYTVGIVESEKTAMILSAQIPDLVWLASSGADGITNDKVKALKGWKVILFPDASKDSRIYKKWKEKADKFGFQISDYLEQHASDIEKVNGFDVADYF